MMRSRYRQRSQQPRWYQEGETNIIPFVDVVMVLLIAFMIGSPLILEGVEVEVPSISIPSAMVEREPIIISVDKFGRYYFNQQSEAIEYEAIRQRVASSLIKNPQATVYIRAHGAVFYEQVAKVLSLLREEGVHSYGLITESAPTSPGRS